MKSIFYLLLMTFLFTISINNLAYSQKIANEKSQKPKWKKSVGTSYLLKYPISEDRVFLMGELGFISPWSFPITFTNKKPRGNIILHELLSLRAGFAFDFKRINVQCGVFHAQILANGDNTPDYEELFFTTKGINGVFVQPTVDIWKFSLGASFNYTSIVYNGSTARYRFKRRVLYINPVLLFNF